MHELCCFAYKFGLSTPYFTLCSCLQNLVFAVNAENATPTVYNTSVQSFALSSSFSRLRVLPFVCFNLCWMVGVFVVVVYIHKKFLQITILLSSHLPFFPFQGLGCYLLYVLIFVKWESENKTKIHQGFFFQQSPLQRKPAALAFWAFCTQQLRMSVIWMRQCWFWHWGWRLTCFLWQHCPLTSGREWHRCTTWFSPVLPWRIRLWLQHITTVWQ